MFFSKNGEKYTQYGVNGEKFSDAMHRAAKGLGIEDREKIHYKETEASSPLILVYRSK